MTQYFTSNTPLELEMGGVLPQVTIAYDTLGMLNDDRSNVVWVCHALTASSDITSWWEEMVGEGRVLDPSRYFIVCANFLGSHYGTTGPLSINPATGQPWYGDFPRITVRDMVACHRRLAASLGIEHVELLMGSSIGGFQCLEWAVMQPDFATHLVLIATGANSTPWISGFNESQRMAIELDATFGSRRDDAGEQGMVVARSLALLSYRGGMAYNLTQRDAELRTTCFERRVHSYQRYQGEKLRRRFNAYSYYRLSQAVDSHNIARGRGTIEQVLSTIRARTMVVAITSDILFTVEENRLLANHIPGAELHIIDSDFGHDGFLVENEQLTQMILNFLNNRDNGR